MRYVKKLVYYLDKGEDYAVLIACLLLFLIGVYGLYDSYLVYTNANDTSLLKYRPGYTTELPDRPIKGNMVAWVTLDDTTVDYPIMQGKTNEEYLNTDPFGDYALSGSIFLDFRNKADFSDDYSLIYGHHMENGYMFGALDKYARDEAYYKSHRTGSIILNDENATTYPMKVVAICDGDMADTVIFSPTESYVQDVIRYVKAHAIFMNEKALNGRKDSEKLVALSTCKYPNSTKRTILFCLMDMSKGKSGKVLQKSAKSFH